MFCSDQSLGTIKMVNNFSIEGSVRLVKKRRCVGVKRLLKMCIGSCFIVPSIS